MNLPEPLSPEQLTTFGGQVAAVYIITLAILSIFGNTIPTRPVILIAALAISIIVNVPTSPLSIVITLVNGLLVYLTVLGASESLPERETFKPLKLK